MVASTKPFFSFTCIVSIWDKFHVNFRTQLVHKNNGIFSFAREAMRAEDEKQEINLEWSKATPNGIPVCGPALSQRSMQAGELRHDLISHIAWVISLLDIFPMKTK